MPVCGSVEAVQAIATWVGVLTVKFKPDGAVGGELSTPGEGVMN